jgi:carbon starvation protein
LHDAAGNPVPAWKAIWPVFGATNQLMAGLALLVVYVWLRKKGKNTLFVGLPMLFMLIMTLWALAELVVQYGFSIVGVIGMILFILAVILVIEAIRTLLRKTVQAAIPPA